MRFDLPQRGDIICYGGDTDLPVQVVTYPLEIPAERLCEDLRGTTCYELYVVYLVDHPTGPLHSQHSWILRSDELHLVQKVEVTA